MFPCITKTWNPIGGQCHHECSYCWARNLIARHQWPKYKGTPRINPKQFNRRFKPDEFVFVQDMSDLFAWPVPREVIQKVLDKIESMPETKFLLLTKNPARYLEFELPSNTVAGATIETDIPRHLNKVSPYVPTYLKRFAAMAQLEHPKMISIEPIMAFSENFLTDIVCMKPEFVAIGYDNYHNKLPEPSLKQVTNLITSLRELRFKVYTKTLREKHD